MITQMNHKAIMKESIKCDVCSAEFEPTRFWSRFCGKKCRIEYHKVRAKEALALLKEKEKKNGVG